MKVVSFETIKELNIPPVQCIEWVKAAFLMQYECTLPAKISMHMDNNIFFNTMPCIIPSINKIGTKLVSRYPQRIPSLDSELLLYEASTGNLLALMDAEWITAMRTGAVAAISIQTFQKSMPNTYAFAGLGNTARATLLCLLDIVGQQPITVKLLKYKDQAESFQKRFENYTNINFITVSTNKDFVKGSDVIVSCITASDNLIGQDEWYEEGVLVVPVHTRGFQNCDLFFDRIFVDDIKHVEGFKNFAKFKYLDEFTNILKGSTFGRTNDKERILVYNIGISIHDIYFASQIYETIQHSKIPDVIIKQKLEKFWI
ncbi:MAG: ornithine cyclodeaminase [Dysgonomonas sp.]|uniref:ornithine cyclodeaminase n=1 Tax=Dysgonomonas sp. TaxID=1891233 RepID=UPI003A887E91